MKAEFRLTALVELFHEHANEVDAGPMSAYMRNRFPFLGIKSPLRKQLIKQFFSEYEMPKGEQLLVEVATLFNKPEREFQYVAIAMLVKGKNNWE